MPKQQNVLILRRRLWYSSTLQSRPVTLISSILLYFKTGLYLVAKKEKEEEEEEGEKKKEANIDTKIYIYIYIYTQTPMNRRHWGKKKYSNC